MSWHARYRRKKLWHVLMILLVAAFVFSLPVMQIAASAQTPTADSDAPVPVQFPQDDGPHPVPIEWWYYTGHLFTESGDRYGFEFVVFKAELSGLVGLASHFAITDNPRGEFAYAERRNFPTGDVVPAPNGGFDLQVDDWRMRGVGGDDRLIASMPGYAVSLRTSPEKTPTLHDGDGYIDYGNGEASYYYSRTRLAVDGTLTVDGRALAVDGAAWMDHQWGNFSTFNEGGWDWFALHLDDGSDLMLYVIRDADGQPSVVDGSLVAPDGSLRILEASDISIEPTGSWTSQATGATYPSGWSISLPNDDLAVTLTPTLPDQELDTTVSTGQIYWEGEVVVDGTRAGEPITGLGYVELTGYAPSTPIGST